VSTPLDEYKAALPHDGKGAPPPAGKTAPATATAKRKHHPVLIGLGVVAALVVLFVLFFDWNMLKHPIERRVTAATGRAFHIDGDLSVKLSLKPRITVDGLRLGNLPGAKTPEMASVQRLQLRLHLVPLVFKHDVVLSEVRVTKPDLLLERLGDGRENWVFPKGKAEWPEIRDLEVGDGRFRFRDVKMDTDLAFDVTSGARGVDARVAPLQIDGKGKYRGNQVAVDGRIDSPLALAEKTRPYRIDLRAHAGATSATAKGTLAGLQLHGFRLDFGLRGPSLDLLFPLLGIALPDTPPYRLQGLLTREERTWHYDDFTGKVGDSDLAGDASVRTGGKRPFLKADLVSKHLDLDDLNGFLGAPPQVTAGESATPEQRAEAAARAASTHVLPDRDFELAKLRNMDADVRLRAHHIETRKLPVETMDAHLYVDDAVLRLDPITFGVAGGTLGGKIRLDARKPRIASSATLHARGMDLAELFPGVEVTKTSVGRVGGDLNLSGSGNSVAKMLGTSTGDVGLTMGRGRISNLLLELAGIDIAESLKFMIGKDRTVPIRCAFSQFTVKDGLMDTRRLAFDTTDTVVFGSGTVNLRDESLKLTLKPQPKDHSLLALRTTLLVDGSFKDPNVHPDIAKITLRLAAAALLGAVTPPAALLATYETGPGKNKQVACEGGPSNDEREALQTAKREAAPRRD
jgi:uncharacterized protein involved in outer membrane biogenesis